MAISQINGASAGSSGTLLSTGAPQSGGVIQTVNATYLTQNSTSSSTAQDTGVTVTITPKFSTSKILIIANLVGIYTGNAGNYVKARIFSNGASLGEFGGAIGYNSAGNASGASSICVIDTPATTSATTYKIQAWSATNGQTVYWCNNNSVSSITALEIAA